MAQYGAQEDQLLESFGFDYDAASDLDVAKYIHKLSEEELTDFVESMTFEQYRRYLSIREMMAEMDEKELLVIIPAYNEEKNIGFVLDELKKPEIAGIAECFDHE